MAQVTHTSPSSSQIDLSSLSLADEKKPEKAARPIEEIKADIDRVGTELADLYVQHQFSVPGKNDAPTKDQLPGMSLNVLAGESDGLKFAGVYPPGMSKPRWKLKAPPEVMDRIAAKADEYKALEAEFHKAGGSIHPSPMQLQIRRPVWANKPTEKLVEQTPAEAKATELVRRAEDK